ncbi:MAG: hypothetical protein WBM07_00980 [Chitinivibrionales bacterium]
MKFKIAFCLLLTGGLLAASPAASSYFNPLQVGSVYLKGETKIYFNFTTAMPNGTTAKWFVVDRARVNNTFDPDNFDKMYALLLTSQLSGKKISGYFDPAVQTSPDGNIAYIVIAIQIQ